MAVHDRYVAVNGDHPMSPDDDAYVRDHFVAATPEAMALMLEDRLPLPSYVLSDQTPMVPAAHGELAEVAGGVDRLHDWFVAFWEGDPATGEREWVAYLSGQHVCLREVNPVRIKQVTERVAEAAAAVDLLRRDPHDPVARGMIGEAVDGVLAVPGLDSLLLPMTAYDRLRFGGPTTRETWVDGPRAEFLTPAPPVWPLRTERLVLRPFEERDAAAYVEAWASEEWTSLLLSRPMNRAEVAEMVRRRMQPGDGRFIGLAVEHDGTAIGDSMLHLQGTDSARARSAGRSSRSMPAGASRRRPRRPCCDWASSTTGCAGSWPTSMPATTAPGPSANASGCGRRSTGAATSGPRAPGPAPTSTPSSATTGAPGPSPDAAPLAVPREPGATPHVSELLPSGSVCEGNVSDTCTPLGGPVDDASGPHSRSSTLAAWRSTRPAVPPRGRPRARPTEKAMRGPRYRRLFRNVLVAATTPPTPVQRVRGALVLHCEQAWASHASAARVKGAPDPDDRRRARERPASEAPPPPPGHPLPRG